LGLSVSVAKKKRETPCFRGKIKATKTQKHENALKGFRGILCFSVSVAKKQ
jgi:hypothetical protein